jgi:hypothetical protein
MHCTRRITGPISVCGKIGNAKEVNIKRNQIRSVLFHFKTAVEFNRVLVMKIKT